MKHITMRQLKVFAEVARRLSITGAANALHLTQPAVTLQVKELEETCGVPLLERMGRRIFLTEAGTEVAACAAKVTDDLRETQERLDALRGLKKGLLKIGAVSTAKYFAPSLLAAFTPSYPGVTVRFSVGNREETIRHLAENEVELAIMGRPPRELETLAEPFAKHPLVIIAAPSHPLARKRRIPLEKLNGESFLIREEGSGTRASMERLFKEKGVPYEASMEVSSNETIKQAVIAGLGISFISAHTVGLELKAGKLVALEVAGLPVVRDWYVIYRKDKRLSPIAEAFRGFVLENGSRIIEKAVGGSRESTALI